MAYRDHDANIIKSVLEHHMVQGRPPDDRQVAVALDALDRLVHNYLPEAAGIREILGPLPGACAQCKKVFAQRPDGGTSFAIQEPNTLFCTDCYKLPQNHEFDVVILSSNESRCRVCGGYDDRNHLQLDPALHEVNE